MEMTPVAGRAFAGLLELRTGQQLAPERRWRLQTVLTPVMRAHAVATLDQLAAEVASGRDPAIGEAVVEALLNNETSFFRDPGAFALVTGHAVDKVAAARQAERRLRIWCAGCSTGQEAYSLAMHFAENAERWADWKIDIVGSDVSRAAVNQARAGRYSQFEVQRGLPIRHMMRWFEPDGEAWRAVPALRSRVQFHVRNLLAAPPAPARFDIVLCRNVLLYFTTEMRTRMLDRLAGTLAKDGFLMLGAGETVIGQTERFRSDADCRGLYRLG